MSTDRNFVILLLLIVSIFCAKVHADFAPRHEEQTEGIIKLLDSVSAKVYSEMQRQENNTLLGKQHHMGAIEELFVEKQKAKRLKEEAVEHYIDAQARYEEGMEQRNAQIDQLEEELSLSLKRLENELQLLQRIKMMIMKLRGEVFTSCKQILEHKPNAKSGVYMISIPELQFSQETFCDMSRHGGGWTLVMRGIGKEIEGWPTTGDLHSYRAVDSSGTFKFADDVINALRSTEGMYRLESFDNYQETRFVSSECEYHHMQTASVPCMELYKDVELSEGLTRGTDSRVFGIGNYGWNGGNLSFLTNWGSRLFWYTGDDASRNSGVGRGEFAGNSFKMWVR